MISTSPLCSAPCRLVVIVDVNPQWQVETTRSPLCHCRIHTTFSLPSFAASPCLTDDQLGLLGEVVFGDLEVERGGALAYTSGDIVVGTVAGAEPATEVTSLADWHTTQMRADTYSSV